LLIRLKNYWMKTQCHRWRTPLSYTDRLTSTVDEQLAFTSKIHSISRWIKNTSLKFIFTSFRIDHNSVIKCLNTRDASIRTFWEVCNSQVSSEFEFILVSFVCMFMLLQNSILYWMTCRKLLFTRKDGKTIFFSWGRTWNERMYFIVPAISIYFDDVPLTFVDIFIFSCRLDNDKRSSVRFFSHIKSSNRLSIDRYHLEYLNTLHIDENKRIRYLYTSCHILLLFRYRVS
jgi:hypothetical protein